MDFKKTSNAYVRMARSAVLKLFERGPNLRLVNTSRLSSFLISVIYSFLTYLVPRCRQTQTSSGNVENTQLRFGLSRRDTSGTILQPRLGFHPHFGNHRTRSTNQPLC